jgi:acetyltransferase-like isoleucine patch superfamily enzyme
MIEKIIRIAWVLKAKKVAKKLKKCGDNFWLANDFEIKNPDCISIGCNFIGDRFLRIQAWCEYGNQKNATLPEIVIGDNVSIMRNCLISSANRIVIGNGCLLGDNVFITDNLHGSGSKQELKVSPSVRKLYSKGPVVIGDNVWIGRNVCIMPGVTIENGAIIAANAVVTHDVKFESIVAGVPAKVIKSEDEEPSL